MSINVNLKPCTCRQPSPWGPVTTGKCDGTCGGQPVVIPCPVPSPVKFTVRLGECCCDCYGAPDLDDHRPDCPGKLVLVSGTISRGHRMVEWEESEVEDACISYPNGAQEYGPVARRIAQERWALVKALVLGRCNCGKAHIVDGCWEHAPSCLIQKLQCTCGARLVIASSSDNGAHDATCPERLLVQRDAVFSDLADMARTEDAAIVKQRSLSAHGFGFDPQRVHLGQPGLRPSAGFLERYVDHLIRQVGELP